ncbi:MULTISPECIES: YkvA family protein [Reichenbachiella]|uniref:Uncharacterized membrane protein YkvA, DUF1232 family n=1 Tax=Reichenbachiella agariperforans TaxID=156994 RepID=A0A1M6M373_REIAG|nr:MULTISPECIES: YkvA family protein [Reichenbachiella]MBU2914535.1 DUF1232 domain-containing protein [Reichenbachiella agariperforans]RJE73952.1 hypothetical protein BGP76_12130 [Reichenbachiella sp. MSK19-1]SHJ77783.1 Uncharacterized membrane protein YkvA, DUF1232 family [Reichenbachiella agariperforans]
MNKEKVFKKYKDKAEGLLKDNDRINNLLSTTTHRLTDLIGNSDKIANLVDKVGVFLRMIKAQVRGHYSELPWRTMLLAVGALLYFITPLDMIPDFIPALGLTDDLAIIFWVYNSIKEDIEQFRLWENTIELENEA